MQSPCAPPPSTSPTEDRHHGQGRPPAVAAAQAQIEIAWQAAAADAEIKRLKAAADIADSWQDSWWSDDR